MRSKRYLPGVCRGATLLLAPALLAAAPAVAHAAADPGSPQPPPAALLVALGLVRWLLLAALALWAGAAAVRLLPGLRAGDLSRRLGTLARAALIALILAAPAEALLSALAPALPAGLSLGAALGTLAGPAGALALLRWLLAAAGLLLSLREPRSPWLALGLAAAALGLTAWLGTLPPPAPAGPPLVLADSADDLLVQLSYTPGRFRVDLSDALARPVHGAAVGLHLVPLSGQGGEQRLALAEGMQGLTFARGLGSVAYTAPGTLPAGGRWRIEVSVSRPGKPVAAATFEVASDQGAQALLALADAAMGRLQSMRQREWLGYGDSTLVTDFEFAAPDRMHLTTNHGFERVAIGASLWDRDRNLPWSKAPWPGLKPFAFPDWHYAAEAVDARLIDTDTVDGHPCFIVAFLHGPSGARFRFWIDQQSYLVRRSVMMAPGHFMRDEYSAFDAPVQIAPPTP